MNKKHLLNILGIILVIILLLILGIGLTILIRSRRGEETITYDAVFGTLPLPINIDMPQNIIVNDEAQSLEVKSVYEVYKIDKKNTFFPSKSLAESVASNLELKAISKGNNVYLFSNSSRNISQTFDATLNTITITYSQGETLIQQNLPTEKEAEIYAKERLQEAGLWPYDSSYSTSFRYYKTSANSYSEVSSKNDATLIGVNFKNTINGTSLLSTRISSGEIEVLVSTTKQILKITYAYRPYHKDIKATYPLKTQAIAFSRVQEEDALLISSFDREPPKSITIQNALLAYKVELKDQNYLQPVYFFEGVDNNDQIVTVLVPAIDDFYLIN